MGFGDSLKKWAQSKATEMLTAEGQKREDAAASADSAERQAKSDVGEQLLRTAFPKLGEWSDQQEANRVASEAAKEQERREEIASLPVATVQLTTTGWAVGQWSGPLHLSWEDIAPDEPDPDNPDSDPYVSRPMAWIELFSPDGARPSLGGHELVHWGFQVPGHTGDGTYDLVAIAREREAAGAALTYEEWAMDFADSEDSSFYFYADAGPSSVTVADGGQRLSVTISMSGAIGEQHATAEISRAAPAAG
jgi:hypothetical protein